MPRRLLPSLLAAVALTGGLLALPTAASAAVGVSAEAAGAAPDFASERFADPWDYANPEDVLLDEGPTMALEGAAVRDGLLQFGMSKPGYLSPLWGGYPGALYLGREGGAPENRLDASRFTRFSLHAYASRDTPAGLMWWSCEGLNPQCQGGQPLTLRAGWHTYDIALSNSGYGLPQAWTGPMTGLRLALSPGSPTSYAIDWMRVYRPFTTVAVSGQGVVWDVDDDPSDNTADRPGWGRMPCGSPCDASFLPAGTYRFAEGGAYSPPVVLRERPRPVLLDPDAVGGPDYASTAGNPWDFAGPDDVERTGNATVLGYGPRLSAVNAGPQTNDPFVWTRLHGGPIDSRRYSRLTVLSAYEGRFDLRDQPGGGSHGRVVWQRQDQPAGTVVQTKEWVTYSGQSRQTYDLNTPGVHEEDVGNRLPWSTSAVTGLRWDPNEDPGARRWSLDRVALRADDEAGSSFAIRWYDAGFVRGTTVALHYDTDASGYDGTLIAQDLGQSAGTNRHVWDTSAVPEGTYWVYAVVSGPDGVGRSYSSGPVRVSRSVAGQGASPAYPIPRDLSAACPQSRVPDDGFADVPPGVHESAVDCVAWWGVARGTGSGFAPEAPVSRGQMATFLAGVIERTGGTLPSDPADAFRDDDGTTHELRIDQLAEVGVVGGFGDGTYRPGATVTREQMATFLARAYGQRTGGELPLQADYFADDGASTHQANIDRVAGAGIAGGTADERYSPSGQVRRAQMGAFLARLLDVLVARGSGEPPAR